MSLPLSQVGDHVQIGSICISPFKNPLFFVAHHYFSFLCLVMMTSLVPVIMVVCGTLRSFWKLHMKLASIYLFQVDFKYNMVIWSILTTSGQPGGHMSGHTWRLSIFLKYTREILSIDIQFDGLLSKLVYLVVLTTSGHNGGFRNFEVILKTVYESSGLNLSIPVDICHGRALWHSCAHTGT